MPVATEFSTLSVKLWVVDLKTQTVIDFSHCYSRALVFFFTQSCLIGVKVAFFNYKTDFLTLQLKYVLLNVSFSCRGSHLTFKWLYHS